MNLYMSKLSEMASFNFDKGSVRIGMGLILFVLGLMTHSFSVPFVVTNTRLLILITIICALIIMVSMYMILTGADSVYASF